MVRSVGVHTGGLDDSSAWDPLPAKKREKKCSSQLPQNVFLSPSITSTGLLAPHQRMMNVFSGRSRPCTHDREVGQWVAMHWVRKDVILKSNPHVTTYFGGDGHRNAHCDLDPCRNCVQTQPRDRSCFRWLVILLALIDAPHQVHVVPACVCRWWTIRRVWNHLGEDSYVASWNLFNVCSTRYFPGPADGIREELMQWLWLSGFLPARDLKADSSELERSYYQWPGVWYASGVWHPRFPLLILTQAFWYFFLD